MDVLYDKDFSYKPKDNKYKIKILKSPEEEGDKQIELCARIYEYNSGLKDGPTDEPKKYCLELQKLADCDNSVITEIMDALRNKLEDY